jgi:hypothetical protein
MAINFSVLRTINDILPNMFGEDAILFLSD